MLPLKVSFFISRAARGWRKLPWDWRIMLVLGVLGLLDTLWGVCGVALEWHSRFAVMALGPFIVRSPVGLVYKGVSSVLVLVQSVGLLLLARWAWALGFAHIAAATTLFLASLASGAFYEAAKLGGTPLDQVGVRMALAKTATVACAMCAGALVWMILRRKAYLAACDESAASRSPHAPTPPADAKHTPQERDDERAARAGERFRDSGGFRDSGDSHQWR